MGITVKWGPTSWIGYTSAVAGVLGAVAAGLATVAGALPDGVPPSVGVALTATSAILGAASFGLTAFVREIRARLQEEMRADGQSDRS